MENGYGVYLNFKKTLLEELEAESIEIVRECYGAFKNPVILYSIGKDSTVLLEIVKKAFHPMKIPFPVMHVDTTWKFKSMINFRDRIFKEQKLNYIIKSNTNGIISGVNPFDYSSTEYTRIMKTVPLREGLDENKFDCAFGGSRRDEERSRAKERVFSLRNNGHIWDPRNQRPELWKSINLNKTEGQSFRVFPLSNWTEIDIWRYIELNELDICDLYFAQQLPTVVRNGQLIVVDDSRFRLRENEVVEIKQVRFRSLGCYPLTAAMVSKANSIQEIILELESNTLSERAGRLIDGEKNDSMEFKKREGYF